MTEKKPIVEVCLSPALLHLYDTSNANVVIIDVFRATSTIATVLYRGAKEVIPVAAVDECIRLGGTITNSITAGERDGKVAPGLQYGNSPLEYPEDFIKDKTMVLTTTNGTKLLHMVGDHRNIITGAFVNLNAVVDFLRQEKKHVILACAAWKDRVNLEDSLFAGAVVDALSNDFEVLCDSAVMTQRMFHQSQGQLLEFLKASNHYRRLSGFGLHEDLAFCTTPDLCPIVPIYKNGRLVKN